MTNNVVMAQLGLACLILSQTMLSFMKPAAEQDDKKSRRSLWTAFAKAEEISPAEERARLARKAQNFWQGGLSLRDWPGIRR